MNQYSWILSVVYGLYNFHRLFALENILNGSIILRTSPT